MQAAAVELNSGTYKEPLKMTVSEWLDIWLTEYLGGVKPMTVLNYTQHVNNHIKPALGAIKLEALNTHEIQSFYNDLQKPHGDKAGLSAKTVKCVNGVLHKALQQAVAVGYLRFNPADACKLPRVERKEIKPLDSEAITAFMKAVEGSRYETLYLLTLFTGMRRGEVCGLQWDCVDLEKARFSLTSNCKTFPDSRGSIGLFPLRTEKAAALPLRLLSSRCLKSTRRSKAQSRSVRAVRGK